jgi:proteasome lid subunit RPN8/RPN11
VAATDNRYLAAPEHQLAAFRSLEKQQLELVAVFHSHPTGEAYPSGIDIEQAHYPNSFYLIISLRNPEQPESRAFRIIDGRIQQVSLIIDRED